MTTEVTQPDTIPTDPAAVDTASPPAAGATADTPADTSATGPTEEELILSAIRGEEQPKAEAGDDPKPVEGTLDTPKEGAKPEAGKEPADKAKADDAILDADTPADYKGRTREQFEKLKEAGRRHREEAQALQAKLTELQPAIEREANFTRLLAESEGTPEDIGTAISLIKAVNKGTLEERQRAFQVVNALRGIIADQIGEVLPEVDVLAAYPDLKQRVMDADLSEADAREIAAARRKGKAVEETVAQQAAREKREQEATQSQQAEVSQRQAAARDVEAMARTYQANDGAAYPIRIAYAQQQFKRITAHTAVSPDKIPALFKELYESAEAQLLVDAATAKARQSAPAGVRPLMGAARGASTATVEAQSEEDAIRQALRGG